MYEVNQIKKTWRTDSLKIALVYPNRYSAMAGLTIQTLYHLWNAFPDVICERFFMPSHELGDDKPQQPSKNFKVSNGTLYPPRRSLESQMSLKNFDIIAFTLCFELDYPNVLWLLQNAGIPYDKHERLLYDPYSKDEDENPEQSEYPLIICGGPAVRSNPVILEPFFDALFLGELEPVNSNFISTLLTGKKEYLIKENCSIYSLYCEGLKKIPGFWVPNQDNPIPVKPIKRVYAEDLDSYNFPVAQVCPIFGKSEENLFPFGEAFYLEVNRGCPYSCRFCITGAQTKPFRNRSMASLANILTKGREMTPFKRVVLIGSAVQDHPDFLKLCQFLLDNKFDFSIPSIRVETLTKEMVELFAQSGMKTITIAPETGSERLRKKIGKSITNKAILNGVRLCLEGGLPNLKAYFLYGLPEENDDDVLAIPDLARQIADFGYGKQAVRVSLNPFVPKAQTPFEACIDNYLAVNMPILKNKLEMISNPLKGNRQIKLETLSIEEAFIETCFSLGDRALSDLIVDLYNIAGSAPSWHRFIKKNTPWQQKITTHFTNLKQSKFGERPWNQVVETNSIDFLAREYTRAIENK